ncbi:MAG: hypothetical protein H7Z21_09520 [Hymenobacter sp.]|nr:hypothetical protein [Hymenobacter sp.]
MSASSDDTRRWVAALIVLLLALQAGSWLWRKYRHAQELPRQQAAEAAIRRKIAASHAYDDALLRANVLLDQRDTAAATRLLDSLRQQPTDSLFRIERQKLRTTLQRLDSGRP